MSEKQEINSSYVFTSNYFKCAFYIGIENPDSRFETFTAFSIKIRDKGHTKAGMNHSELFCGTAWNETQSFIIRYLYGSMIVILELIGTPFSILTVITLAKNISSSNILFASLAISDMMVLLLQIPQLYFQILHHQTIHQLHRRSYTVIEKGADHYLATYQKIFYNISVYQTVILAIWQYIAITLPLKERMFCNVRRTLATILTVYTLCFFYFVPDLLQIPPETENENDELKARYSNLFFDLFYIIVLKLMPCTIVTIFTARFVRVLRESKARRKQNMTSNFNKELEEKEIQINQSTRMVIGIMIFFVINNTALAVGRILILIFGPKFKKYCFPAILCINNILVFTYSAIPFVVFYVTSQQFRDDFKSLIPCRSRVLFKDKSNAVDLIDCLDIEISA